MNGMNTEGLFRLAESRVLTASVRLLRLEGDTGAIAAPGQFVAVEIAERFLRRPFSVCDWGDGWLTLIVEKIGYGTEWLHTLPVGSELRIMTGLGHGFDFTGKNASEWSNRQAECLHPLLIGCGTGLSPLVGLARRMRKSGIHPTVLLGFREECEQFGAALFSDPGCSRETVRYTSDLWASVLEIPHDCFYACGSEAVMTELCGLDPNPGQVAFDVRMGCGFGACMGCSMKTNSGARRICREGPVFEREDIIW
mgnify:FL=1